MLGIMQEILIELIKFNLLDVCEKHGMCVVEADNKLARIRLRGRVVNFSWNKSGALFFEGAPFLSAF